MKANASLSDITRKNVELIARIEAASDLKRPVGLRLAERLGGWMGSWTFILAWLTVLAGWIIVNAAAWSRHWDPYPFILLNLILAFQAALAGPVLMMSQNRQARLNEQRNHLDLQINLLAEQENTEILILLRKICEQLEVPIASNSPVESLANETDPHALIQQIQATQGGQRPGKNQQ